MRKLVNDPRLMTKVCDMYYNQKMSQQQIMAELSLSRPTVARLLDTAREEGIVQITIPNLDVIKYWELERIIAEKYGLREVMVVDAGESDQELKESLGKAAARYLQYTLTDDSTIGISMGDTLYHMTNHLEKRNLHGIKVVPLVGGMGQLRMELHANSLAESVAKEYDGEFIPLHVPGRVTKASVRRELLRDESVARAVQCMEQADIALVGIGYPSERSALKATGYYKEKEIEMLIEKHVAGELCMQFYDVNGNTAPYKKDINVIGIDVKKLRKISVSVGIAGGIEKFPAVKGAIAGRYINTLITDVDCARQLAADETICE